MRLTHPLAAVAAALWLALVLQPWHAQAADLHITLPALVAAPGSTVAVPLDVTPGPNGFGIVAMDFTMPLNPAVVASSSLITVGFLNFWGPPFVNTTASLAAGAAAGLTTVVSASPRMCTVMITVKGSALPGTVMPLTFSTLRFNEGAPSCDVTPGSLTITSAVDAPPLVPSAGALLAPRPNPARGTLHAEFTLVRGGDTRLTLHDLQGRVIRVLALGRLEAGLHESTWDGRDDRGVRVPAGMLLLCLHTGSETQVRRVVWVK